MSEPVSAVLPGRCIGGWSTSGGWCILQICDLMIADLVVAAANTVFKYPQVQLGSPTVLSTVLWSALALRSALKGGR